MDVKEKISVIKREIIDEARNKKEKIISIEEEKWEKKYSKFQEEISQKEEKILTECHREASRKKEEIMSKATLDKKNKKRKLFQKLLEDLKEELLGCLEEFRNNSNYPAFLLRLIKEASRTLDSDHLLISLNETDSSLYKTIEPELKQLSGDFELKKEPAPIRGGVIVEDIEGKEVVEYSFQTCLELVDEEMAIELQNKIT